MYSQNNFSSNTNDDSDNYLLILSSRELSSATSSLYCANRIGINTVHGDWFQGSDTNAWRIIILCRQTCAINIAVPGTDLGTPSPDLLSAATEALPGTDGNELPTASGPHIPFLSGKLDDM